jgi:GT2 family glycosyltransferase
MLSISVIVTTYERPKALNAVLKSLSLQKKLPTEIISVKNGRNVTPKIKDQMVAKKPIV